MKQNNLGKAIRVIAFGLQLIAQALTVLIVWKLNILPAEYAIPLLIGFALLSLLSAKLLFGKRKGKFASKDRRVGAHVFATIIICACVALAAIVFDLYDTMQGVTSQNDSGVIRSVYVRVEDPAQTLEDARDYQFAYARHYDTKYTQLAVENIEKQLNSSIETYAYASVPEMVDALLAGQTDAIILNDAYVGVLEESEKYADFSEKTRLLCDIEIKTDADASDDEKSADRVTKSAFIMYVSGSDTRSSNLDVSRSDVNILAVVNPVTKQILLVNTPRDYYIPNPAGDGALDKLTHCGIYGVECSMQALSDLYDVDVEYYSRINFTGFETLVDAIGGVTIYSDVAFDARGHWIQVGENHLNGVAARDFARERFALSGGDHDRGKNQMKLIKAIFEKMTSGTTLIKNYADIMESLEGMFATSLSSSEISMLVKMQLKDMSQWNISSFAVTGTGGSEKTYSMPGAYAYVMYPDENTVAYASQLIQRVIDGDILSDADLQQ